MISSKTPPSSSSKENIRAPRQTLWRVLWGQVAIGLALALILPAGMAAASGRSSTYTKTILASDLPGTAPNTDPNLVNPWGLSHSRKGPWIISGNGSGEALTYNGEGVPVAPPISIPSPSGQANGGTPTGNVFNRAASSDPDAFVIKKGNVEGPSTFMFATEDGTIAGWNKRVDPNSAIIKVDRSTATDNQGDVGAVYKGLAFAENRKGNPHIYATNFRFGTVEMFDEHFTLVRSFTDPKLTSTCPVAGQCFAPFGIQNIDGNLYVTFALQDADKHDDVAGPGNGFVDVFSPEGKLIKRLIARGKLNSPWGLAVAPGSFGQFGHSLLVGNFGDGTINAYDVDNGDFEDTLKDSNGNPIQTDGLWAIAFGNNGEAGKKRDLFFAAGIEDEAHGVFGKITKN